MVKSTIDEIKDITLERQIRKLAGVIDEQNQTIEMYGDATTDINNLKISDANQNTEINKLKTDSSVNTTDIDNLKASDANQTIQINNLKQAVAADKLATESAITNLQNKDTEQDGTLTDHSTQIKDITESLVSNVQIMSGTTTGEIKVRLERESSAAIDSNNYNLGLPVSAEIIQGTGPSMFKIQITMSSGVKVVSNDFVFTTEAIGNDVYISSFTFKAGNQTGYLSADIGLNNGVVIEANNFLVPTDPNVTSAITDLQSRMSAVESTGVAGFNELKTTVDGHTASINELNTDVTNLTTNKADVNNGNQIITAGTVNATNINKSGVAVATVNDIPDISGKVNIAQGTENAGKVLGIGVDGNVTPVEGSSSGEVWEEVDLSNFPTDWAVGDRIKVQFAVYFSTTAPSSWGSTPTNVTPYYDTTPYPRGSILEFQLENRQVSYNALYFIRSNNYTEVLLGIVDQVASVNIFNNTAGTDNLFTLHGSLFNGGGCIIANASINRSNASNRVYKMWRCRASA